jgi:hypothetical protein
MLMNSRGGPLLGGCKLMNSRGGPPIWGCMLLNSSGGPPILRGVPPLGTISMDLRSLINGYTRLFKRNPLCFIT